MYLTVCSPCGLSHCLSYLRPGFKRAELQKCLQFHEDQKMPTDQPGLQRTKKPWKIPRFLLQVFIMICILCNTTFMALERHGKSPELEKLLVVGNYVFTAIFTFECFMKLIALGVNKYFKEMWNAFDFVVVSFSLFELGQELHQYLTGGGGASISGLSVLRSLRLVSPQIGKSPDW